MPVYVFSCAKCGASFENFVRHLPEYPPKSSPCPNCSDLAPRDMGKERVYTNGLAKTGGGKGSILQETRQAFGTKIVGGQQASFFDSVADMDKFMAGNNAMGPRILEGRDRNGNPVFAKTADGQYRHSGLKLVKYDPNQTPSRSANPPPSTVTDRAERLNRLTGDSNWGDEPPDTQRWNAPGGKD